VGRPAQGAGQRQLPVDVRAAARDRGQLGDPGGALYHDPTVLTRVKAALEILYVNQYNENTGEIGNWYSYEIGVRTTCCTRSSRSPTS